MVDVRAMTVGREGRLRLKGSAIDLEGMAPFPETEYIYGEISLLRGSAMEPTERPIAIGHATVEGPQGTIGRLIGLDVAPGTWEVLGWIVERPNGPQERWPTSSLRHLGTFHLAVSAGPQGS